jgi:carbon starvation protein CstA
LAGEPWCARRSPVAGWGWFLYQGVVDPLGGINTLWPLFGHREPELAGLAMIFVCAVLVKMKRERYLWVAAVPTAWLLIVHADRGLAETLPRDPKIGFLANCARFSEALARGEVLAPAKSLDEMRRVIFNNQLDAALCALFMGVVVLTLVFAMRAALRARAEQHADRDGDAACGARCGSLSTLREMRGRPRRRRAPGDRLARLRRYVAHVRSATSGDDAR